MPCAGTSGGALRVSRSLSSAARGVVEDLQRRVDERRAGERRGEGVNVRRRGRRRARAASLETRGALRVHLRDGIRRVPRRRLPCARSSAIAASAIGRLPTSDGAIRRRLERERRGAPLDPRVRSCCPSTKSGSGADRSDFTSGTAQRSAASASPEAASAIARSSGASALAVTFNGGGLAMGSPITISSATSATLIASAVARTTGITTGKSIARGPMMPTAPPGRPSAWYGAATRLTATPTRRSVSPPSST